MVGLCAGHARALGLGTPIVVAAVDKLILQINIGESMHNLVGLTAGCGNLHSSINT
jgi:hypothetical protein